MPLTGTRPSTWRVCQFRHSSVTVCIIADRGGGSRASLQMIAARSGPVTERNLAGCRPGSRRVGHASVMGTVEPFTGVVVYYPLVVEVGRKWPAGLASSRRKSKPDRPGLANNSRLPHSPKTVTIPGCHIHPLAL
jgi:hypothetical protein